MISAELLSLTLVNSKIVLIAEYHRQLLLHVYLYISHASLPLISGIP